MDTIKECHVCNNTNFDSFLELRDYFLTKESFTLVACSSCGFVFTNPRPDMNNLEKYYESIDYISHSNKKKGFINSLYQLVRNYTVKRKANILKNYFRKGKVLDIGCGSGEFLNELKKRKWDVTGIEPNNSARRFAGEQYDLRVFEEDNLNKFKDGSFDIITMWHVLEHVFHLNDRVLQIKRLLKKNGVLIVALPNLDSLDAKIYEKFWAAYDVPRHLYHFNKKSVELLFQKYDFDIVNVKPMLFDSFYVSMLSEKYKPGKENFIEAIINGLRSNMAASLGSKNYSSIIYILKCKNS